MVGDGQEQLAQVCLLRHCRRDEALVQHLREPVTNYVIDQRILVREMVVERGSVDGGAGGDVLNSDLLEGLFRHNVGQIVLTNG